MGPARAAGLQGGLLSRRSGGPDEGSPVQPSVPRGGGGGHPHPPGPGTSSGALLAPPPMPRWGTRLTVDKLVSLSWAERAPSCAHWQDSKGFEE